MTAANPEYALRPPEYPEGVHFLFHRPTIAQRSDGCREGVWGEGGSKAGTNAGSAPRHESLCLSASPQSLSFGSFLVRTQESNTLPLRTSSSPSTNPKQICRNQKTTPSGVSGGRWGFIPFRPFLLSVRCGGSGSGGWRKDLRCRQCMPCCSRDHHDSEPHDG